MRDRIAFFAALMSASTLLGSSAALGQERELAPHETTSEPKTTSVPVNVGLVPYVDVNSHLVRPRNHLSIDGIAGAATELEGAAIAGVSGFVWRRARGVQVAGVSGYVGGDLTGAQIAGVVSATRGEVTGFQTGVVSYAGSVTGAQVALVNVGGTVKGLQLGLVNVAGEADRGATVGLVNVVGKNGRHQIDVSTSNTAAFSVGTKLGTKHVYSILGMGLQPVEGHTAWMPTVGIGASIPIREETFVNIESLVSAVNFGEEFDRDTLLAQLRATAGNRVIDGLALYAGPVFDVFRSSSGKRLSDVSYLPTLSTADRRGVPVDMGLGFVVGMQAL